ncbi:hypothetical protein B0H14DRAFT_3595159 [Mycena olivaceomarginata]|nr:hypothetical protein B0H14DRAFT_3595159 [Mycena olivaceomarginata]
MASSDAPPEKPASKALVVLNVTDAPLFFLLVQLIIAVLLFGIADVLRILPNRLTFDLKICKGLVYVVGLNVLGLSFSNYTLKYVDASFYQVARGLVLPFTVGVSFAVLHSRPSSRILVSCAAVTAGFFCGVLLDGTPLSLVGVAFGVSSSSITALASVINKQSLAVVDGSAILLSWYANLLSAIALAPIVLIAGEGPSLKTFLWGSLITGGLGFLMSLAGILSIKVTSPITHMVSSAVRGVAQSFLGLWYFHDIISRGRAASIAIILGGSIYYTWVKHKETEAAAYERVPMDDLEGGKLEGPDSPEEPEPRPTQ